MIKIFECPCANYDDTSVETDGYSHTKKAYLDAPRKEVMTFLKNRLKQLLCIVLALAFIIESWLWVHVREWLRGLNRILGLDHFDLWLKKWAATHSPYAALCLFLIPAGLILPVKIIALGLIAKGRFAIGLFSILLAKILALGVASYLFDLLRKKLLEIAWFKYCYALVLKIRIWSRRLLAPLRSQIRQIVFVIKSYVKEYSTIILIKLRYWLKIGRVKINSLLR